MIGVDPYTEMLAKIPEDAAIKRLVMVGLEFSRQSGSYELLPEQVKN